MSCGGQAHPYLPDGSSNPRFNVNAGAINDARGPYQQDVTLATCRALFHAEIQAVKTEMGIRKGGGTRDQQHEVEALARTRIHAAVATYVAATCAPRRDSVGSDVITGLRDAFARSRHGTRFGDLTAWPANQFAGLCEDINGAFARHLHDEGLEPTVNDYAGRGTGHAPPGFPHTVTVCDGWVYDFSYRQIDPDGAIPHVVPVDAWEQDWRLVAEPRTMDDLGPDEDDDGFGVWVDDDDGWE